MSASLSLSAAAAAAVDDDDTTIVISMQFAKRKRDDKPIYHTAVRPSSFRSTFFNSIEPFTGTPPAAAARI